MDGTSNKGTEHVQSWMKKLKESQDRKKDEKIRRYNDVVSRLIILLIGVCIVCVIVIAALIVQNEGQKKNYRPDGVDQQDQLRRPAGADRTERRHPGPDTDDTGLNNESSSTSPLSCRTGPKHRPPGQR